MDYSERPRNPIRTRLLWDRELYRDDGFLACGDRDRRRSYGWSLEAIQYLDLVFAGIDTYNVLTSFDAVR